MYTTTTLATLKTGMEERYDGSIFWSEEEARLAINEALREWNLLVGRWSTSVTLSTGAGVVEYATGATLLYNARVKVAGVPLIVASTLEMDLARPTWRGETTASGGDVPTLPVHWAPISLQRIAIWPATAAAGVNNLIVSGVAATPVLVEDGDTVDLGEELHDPLLDFALHIAAFKEGGARWQATMPYMVEFLKMAAQENSLLKASKAFRRFAGLDRNRDLHKTLGGPTEIDKLTQPGGQG